MTEPTPSSDAPQTSGTDSQQGYYLLLLAAGAFITGAGYLWRGLDFAGATLLGFAVVALNTIWTRNLVRSVFVANRRRKGFLVVSFLAKLALTALVLFLAIVRFQVDPFGILFGLTAMVLVNLLFAYYIQPKQG